MSIAPVIRLGHHPVVCFVRRSGDTPVPWQRHHETACFKFRPTGDVEPRQRDRSTLWNKRPEFSRPQPANAKMMIQQMTHAEERRGRSIGMNGPSFRLLANIVTNNDDISPRAENAILLGLQV